MAITLEQGTQSVISQPNAKVSVMTALKNFSAFLGQVGDIVIETKKDIETYKQIDDQMQKQDIVVTPDQSSNFYENLTDIQKKFLQWGILGLIAVTGLILIKKL
jgi:hypothetical protein